MRISTRHKMIVCFAYTVLLAACGMDNANPATPSDGAACSKLHDCDTPGGGCTSDGVMCIAAPCPGGCVRNDSVWCENSGGSWLSADEFRGECLCPSGTAEFDGRCFDADCRVLDCGIQCIDGYRTGDDGCPTCSCIE